MQVVIVALDHELRARLAEPLRRFGFQVKVVDDLSLWREAVDSDSTPVILLEGLCPAYRKQLKGLLRDSASPPILTILEEDNPNLRCEILEAGTDDCLGPRFSIRELVARIKVLLRRSALFKAPSQAQEVNGVHIDPKTRTVAVHGHQVELTTVEFQLLEALMRSAGNFLTRDELCTVLHGRNSTPFERSIDLHISRLRRKLHQKTTLGDLATHSVTIKTVRSKGYQFCVAEPETPRALDETQTTLSLSRLGEAVASFGSRVTIEEGTFEKKKKRNASDQGF
jgi:DNA-binding response OmpR family regulator